MTGPQGWAAPDPDPTPAQPVPPPGPGSAGPPPGPGWGGPPPGSGWGGPPPASGWQAPAGWGPPPAAPGGGQGGWGSAAPPAQPGVVPLRPLGLGELLDGAVTLVRRYPRPTLGLSAGIALVTTLLNLPLLLTLAGSPLLDPGTFEPGTTVDLESEIGGLVTGLSAASLLSLLSGVVLAGVITSVVGRGVLGQPMTLGQAWASVRPLLPRLVGLAVVVLLVVWGPLTLSLVLTAVLGVATGGLGLALGLPLTTAAAGAAVYLYVRLSLAPCAMVLERAGLATSLRRSAALVRGDWWRVFGILLLVLVITSFVSQVLQTPFAIRSFTTDLSGQGAGPGPVDVVLQSIGSTLALTVVAPFGAAVRALLYVDRRIRAEALDVSLAAAARAQ